MLKLCTLGLLLCLLAPSQETFPGSVVRIKKEALEYACQRGRPSLIRGLRIIQVPKYVQRGSLLGSLLNVVGINIVNVQLPQLSVNLVPKTGVQLSLGADLHLRVNLILAPVELKLGSSIKLDVRVMRSPHGFPVLSITACKSLLGDVQILVGGSNLLGILRPIQDHIRAVLVDKMCLSISNTVLGLNGRLSTLVGLNAISPSTHLQYSMLDPPEITNEYIEMDLGAAFEQMGRPIEVDHSQVPPFSLPPPAGPAEGMLSIGLSEEVYTNLFASLEKASALNLNIGGLSNPGGHRLTSSMLEPAIPSITRKYPQGAAIEFGVSLSAQPVFNFQEGVAILRLSPTVQVAVAESSISSQAKNLCTLGVDLTLALKLDVAATKVQISVALQGGIGLDVRSSGVKIVEVSKLREIVRSVLEKYFLVHLNGVLSAGISLPKLNNIQYVDPHIEIHEGYTQVNCDFDYEP